MGSTRLVLPEETRATSQSSWLCKSPRRPCNLLTKLQPENLNISRNVCSIHLFNHFLLETSWNYIYNIICIYIYIHLYSLTIRTLETSALLQEMFALLGHGTQVLGGQHWWGNAPKRVVGVAIKYGQIWENIWTYMNNERWDKVLFRFFLGLL